MRHSRLCPDPRAGRVLTSLPVALCALIVVRQLARVRRAYTELGHALRHGDDLLSAIAETAYIGPGMRLLTPLGAISPLERATPAEVRDPVHPGAFATGQFILIRRGIYARTGGYADSRLRATFA